MSNQTQVTIVIANRPRLFRELLQHALKTASANFRVVEATDTMPAASTLNNANWLIVDDEAAAEARTIADAHPSLGILSLDSRGSRARILSENGEMVELTSGVPTLAGLIDLLKEGTTTTKTQLSQAR